MMRVARAVVNAVVDRINELLRQPDFDDPLDVLHRTSVASRNVYLASAAAWAMFSAALVFLFLYFRDVYPFLTQRSGPIYRNSLNLAFFGSLWALWLLGRYAVYHVALRRGWTKVFLWLLRGRCFGRMFAETELREWQRMRASGLGVVPLNERAAQVIKPHWSHGKGMARSQLVTGRLMALKRNYFDDKTASNRYRVVFRSLLLHEVVRPEIQAMALHQLWKSFRWSRWLLIVKLPLMTFVVFFIALTISAECRFLITG